jgi:hypothetical protein
MATSAFQNNKSTIGLAPVADAFSGTVYSDVVSMAKHNEVLFTIIKGVGTTGTSTITVQACDDFTPSNRSAVPFRYRVCTTMDAWGDWTQVAATGFATTAGSNQLYEIEVRNESLPDGYPNVQLKAVEVANDPVLGGILITLGTPKYGGESPATSIA